MNKYKIFYIAGYGRSGSTLISMLLNTQKEVVNIGESVKLFRYPDVQKYTFWNKLRLESEKKTGLKRMSKVKYASYFWYFFKFNKGFAIFKKVWPWLFEQIGTEFKTNVFIDASKSTRGAFARPIYMKKANANIKVIHVIKNPFGVMHSFQKGRNTSGSEKLKKGKRGGGYRALLNWFFINSLVSIIYKKYFKSSEMYILDFDKFTHHYEEELKKLFDFLELPFDQSLLHPKIKLDKDLSFSGNRIRLQEEIEIKPSKIVRFTGIKNAITRALLSIYKLIEKNYDFK